MTEKITIEVVKPTSKIRNKSGEKNWKNPKRISFETPCIFLIPAKNLLRREQTDKTGKLTQLTLCLATGRLKKAFSFEFFLLTFPNFRGWFDNFKCEFLSHFLMKS